jgi:hypothetical protein
MKGDEEHIVLATDSSPPGYTARRSDIICIYCDLARIMVMVALGIESPFLMIGWDNTDRATFLLFGLFMTPVMAVLINLVSRTPWYQARLQAVSGYPLRAHANVLTQLIAVLFAGIVVIHASGYMVVGVWLHRAPYYKNGLRFRFDITTLVFGLLVWATVAGVVVLAYATLVLGLLVWATVEGVVVLAYELWLRLVQHHRYLILNASQLRQAATPV